MCIAHRSEELKVKLMEKLIVCLSGSWVKRRQFGPLTCQSSTSKHKQDQLPTLVYRVPASAQSERTGVDFLGTGLDLKALGDLSHNNYSFLSLKMSSAQILRAGCLSPLTDSHCIHANQVCNTQAVSPTRLSQME